jgi:hypothetical protein
MDLNYGAKEDGIVESAKVKLTDGNVLAAVLRV